MNEFITECAISCSSSATNFYLPIFIQVKNLTYSASHHLVAVQGLLPHFDIELFVLQLAREREALPTLSTNGSPGM